MKVLSFGEILFDCYPTKETIGGAPFNVSTYLAALGWDSFLYSAIGQDERGKNAKEVLAKHKVQSDFLQENPNLPTGICRITYRNKEPIYDLSQYSAYDAIIEQNDVYADSFDALYFGTLAQRNETSRKTLQKLIQKGQYDTVFFDMNLRQNYYHASQIEKDLKMASIVKVNREEFSYVKQLALCPDTDIQEECKTICQRYDIATLLVTLDKDGAACYDSHYGFTAVRAVKSKFVSAVGAGDSFSACFLHHFKQGKSPQAAMKKAGLLASYVISARETIPPLLPHILEKVR